MKTNYIFLSALLCLAVSCRNNTRTIPFPEQMERPQPLTVPVQFSEPTNLSWPEGKEVRPMVQKFDLDNLPSRTFDSTGFMSFSKPPEQRSLDWDRLPDTVFNYDKLPVRPLKFDISVLKPPQSIKTSLHLKNGVGDLLYEAGEPLNTGVGALLEDKNGFLWIACTHGLYRYDGKDLIRFVQGPLMEPRTMIEDNKDQIWIASVNGIYVINPKTGILKHLTAAGGLLSDNLFYILSDKQNRIWVVGFNENNSHNGLSIIDEDANTIKWFGTAQGMSNPSSVGIMQDNLNNIWVSALFGGVNIIDLEHGKIKYLNRKSGLISDSVSAMTQDAQNRIWIADLSGRLNVISGDKKNISYYGAAQGLKRNAVWQLMVDHDGNVWLATVSTPFAGEAQGLEIIDVGRNAFKILAAGSFATRSEVFFLVEDKRRQIWIGSDGGLHMMHRDGSDIEYARNQNVTSLAEDRQGRIWVGLVNLGIEVIDSATRTIRSLTTRAGICNDSIQNIRFVGGRIYISSNGGIDILDSNFKTITHLGPRNGLTFQGATTFSKDSHGRFWISNGFKARGIDVYDPERRTIQHLGSEHGMKDSSVLDIVEDRQKRIWFTRVGGATGVIDPGYKIIRYIKDVPALNEIYSKTLLADGKGNVWMGTGKGIYVVNSTADSITWISSREGLIGDNIISLNQYKDHVYAGTKKGLTIITSPFLSPEKKWEFESFGAEQGIRKVTGSWESDAVTSGGRFLWGDAGITTLSDGLRFIPSAETHVTGINVFNLPQYFSNKPWTFLNEKDTLRENDPDTFYVRGQLPSNIALLKQTHIKFDSVSGFYNMPANLSLPYDKNYLQFHFAQVHGGDKDTIWYRYILEGADKNWSERTFSSASKNYFNLAPGNYTFKVTSLLNGKWSKPAELSFMILPPWWRTWWAYSLFTLIFFVIIYAAAQYRSRKLKAANLALEEKINQRTAELKQSLQELRATQAQLIQSEKMASLGELTAGIAHEIQNPLNFVNNFSEVNNELIEELKSQKDGEIELLNDIYQNNEKIIFHGKRADAIVKGMLQHSRTSSGQKELTDINALADEYLRLAYHGLRAKDKSFNAKFETDLDKTIEKINVIPQDIGRVILNLINNAFYAVSEKKKQLNGTYEPTVTIKTKKQDGKIEISVKDNGNGISRKVLDKILQPFFTTKPTGQGTGLGLSLSYDIVKAHGGDLKVETKEGEGAEFIVVLPGKLF